MIDVQIQQDGDSTYTPYTAMVCEEEEPTKIFNDVVAGLYGNIVNVDAKRYEDKIKYQRNMLLANTDWTQAPDINESTKQKWVTYRQQLRDITDQEGYPFNVLFPTKPE